MSNFIGKTGIIADVLALKIKRLLAGELASPLDRRWLFTGPPGVGKSALAADLARSAAGHPLNVDFRMGTAVNVDIIRDWVQHGCYRPMLGDFTVRFIDEIDTTPSAAITELRGYLDTLPPSVLFIATTNRASNELAEPLQTRFQPWHFESVSAAEISALLIDRYPALPRTTVALITQRCLGNVRAALIAAAAEMDVAAYRTALPAAA